MSWFSDQKPPRKYAEEIMQEPSKDKRREMFDRVPDEFKEMVMSHCKTAMRANHGSRGVPKS